MDNEKGCNVCFIKKKVSEFRKLKASPDGIAHECKDCARMRGKEYYLRNRNLIAKRVKKRYPKNRDAILKYSAEWSRNNPEKVKERHRRHTKTAGFKIRNSARSRRYRYDNPEKFVAHKILKEAVKSGKMIRPDMCSKCEAICLPHGHHENYNRPLYVIWLCASCHRLLHADKNRKHNIEVKP